MARLSTQPSTSNSTPLRSGFFAVPFKATGDGGKSQEEIFVYLRLHGGGDARGDEDEEEQGGAAEKLFVTSLPARTTVQVLQKVFSKLFTSNIITDIQLLDPLDTSYTSLSQQSFESAVLPLFSPSSSTSSPISAIISFRDKPTLPPPNSSSISWPFPAPKSFLSVSAARYSAARPHLSTIIAHSDSWMSSHDRKRLAAISLANESLLQQPLSKKAKVAKGKKGALLPPAPGSAAAALAAHLVHVAQSKDRTRNPDAVVEEDWTLVSRGGKHGKSLLPAGAVPTLTGYGGSKNVPIMKKRKLGDDAEIGDREMKPLEGFYSFTKADTRRAGE